MISAREIRSGNYHKTELFAIPRMQTRSATINGDAFESISAYGVYLVEMGSMIFEPLVLCDEWFEGFGFEKMDDVGTKTIWAMDDFLVIKQQNYHWSVLHNGEPAFKPFFWVHELQNIYYELNKDDLFLSLQKKTYDHGAHPNT